MVRLLDVNVLIALAWTTHPLHVPARRWLSANRQFGWATCPQTQAAFLRLSMQPHVVDPGISFRSAMASLDEFVAAPSHQFWPQNYPCSEIIDAVTRYVRGHKQIADAMLLDLAIRNGGRLATFDSRLHSLLPLNSPLQAAIELIPTASSSQ